MSFNTQIEFASMKYSTAPRKKYIYKQSVQIKRMAGKQTIMFRLLPAFDPNNMDASTSFLPCVSPEGLLNDWGAAIRMAKFVGHDQDIRNTHEIVSLKTLERPGEPVFCPYAELLNFIRNNQDDWGYLTSPSGEWGTPSYRRECLPALRQYLVCNIFDINDPTRGCQVGEFSISAAKTIYDRKMGIMFTPNGMPGIEDMIKQNYLLQYANGDITNPTTGPVLMLERDTASSFAGYRVSIATDAHTRSVCRAAVDPMIMQSRVHLQNFHEYLNIMEPQEMVDYLATILTERSPKGYHEYALLKMALPDFKVPEPPSAPAATNTIQSGFSHMPTPVAPVAPIAPTTPVASAASVSNLAPVPGIPITANNVAPVPTVTPPVPTVTQPVSTVTTPVSTVTTPVSTVTPPVSTVTTPVPTVTPAVSPVGSIPGEEDFSEGWARLKERIQAGK
jgi:hypothetical protein